MILLLFFLFINFSFEEHIIYNFQTKKLELKIFPDSFLYNDIFINFSVGTPEQIIPLNIRLQSYITFITSEDYKKSIIKKFSYNSSSTFKKIMKSKIKFKKREYEEGFKVSDTIRIKNKKIENFQFLLMHSINYCQSGILGLKIKENHDSLTETSFIYQLKKKNIISNYCFSINYLNDEKGELIIGEYPHQYNKNYLENNFVYMKSGVDGSLINWIIDFDDIYYSNIRIKGNKKTILQIEFGFIIGNKEFFNIVKNDFFDKNNKCQLNNNNIYKFFICENDVDLFKFKQVSFGLKDIKYSFNFTFHDLFLDLNNKKYFQIIFLLNDTKNNEWVFGKPFFKKNFLIFDADRKIIGMYINNKKSFISEYFNIFLLYIFGFVIIALLTYIFLYLRKNKYLRSKRYNELELLV